MREAGSLQSRALRIERLNVRQHRRDDAQHARGLAHGGASARDDRVHQLQQLGDHPGAARRPQLRHDGQHAVLAHKVGRWVGDLPAARAGRRRTRLWREDGEQLVTRFDHRLLLFLSGARFELANVRPQLLPHQLGVGLRGRLIGGHGRDTLEWIDVREARVDLVAAQRADRPRRAEAQTQDVGKVGWLSGTEQSVEALTFEGALRVYPQRGRARASHADGARCILPQQVLPAAEALP